MFHRLGLIHRNQRGFTIIELLIAFALTGIVAGATTTAIVQVFDGSARSSNHMTAVRQVQNAGYWVSRDAQMAETVVTTGATGFPLTLTWIEWDSGDAHQVVYSLVDMSGGLKNLQRQHTCVALGLDETGIMAQYIDPDNTQCELAGGSAFSLPDSGDAFTITDAVGGDSGTITVTAGSISVTGTGTWADPNWSTTAGQTIIVTATAANTEGVWTSTAKSATAAIATDTNGDATLSAGGMLIFTVTATVGSDSQEKSETRVYEVIPRPGS